MSAQLAEKAKTTNRHGSTQTIRREADQPTVFKLFKTGQVSDRDQFIRANRGCVECLYQKARNAQVAVSAMAVLDLRDRDAATVARSCVPDQGALRQLVSACAEDSSIPTAIVALTPEYAAEKIGGRFPDLLHELCQGLPERSFHLIAFAFGGHNHWTQRRRSGCGC